MRARDFADQIVGAKQSKLAADPGGASAGLLGVDETGKEDASEIAIAESVEGKLATMDGCEQGAVVGKGTERTHPAAAPLSGLPQMLEQLFQRGRFIDAGESIQVALSCLARDFGSAMQISNATPHLPPSQFPFRVALLGAVDAEVAAVVDGSLGA